MSMKEDNKLPEQKMLPHDENTEVTVLATLMRYNDLFEKYGDLLCDDLFYYEKERAMYRCIEGVITKGGMTDINSLDNYMQSNDIGYEHLTRHDFVSIISEVNQQAIEQDIMRLRDMSRRRNSWKALMTEANRVLDMTCDLDDELSATLSVLGELQGDGGNDGISSHADAVDELLRIVDDNQRGKNNYLRTGFRLFDGHYILRPDTLTVIAAFTSAGKSSLAYNIVKAVAKNGVPCAYYSLEMGKSELVSRGISKGANMSASEIMNKRLTDEQLGVVRQVAAGDKSLPIFYDDRSTVDFNRTMRSIRTMVKTRGVRLAVIDYLQVYAQNMEDGEQSISYMARTCKNVAKELRISIILLSQLNRSGLHPTLKMLRGSGQIEESADNVILIDRPEAYMDNKVTKYEGEFSNTTIKGTAKLILAKGRGVGTGCDLLAFDGRFTQFSQIEKPDGGKHFDHDDDLPF